MIRANTIRTIVRIICQIVRMISCVARIIVSQSAADITISGKLFHTLTILGAKENFLKS